MSKKQDDNILKIAFSLGSLLDTSEVEKIYKEKGLRAYVDALQEMDKKGEVFNPGPALGFYLAFKKLNSIVPDDVLNIKLGLISRNSPNPEFSGSLFRSYRKWVSDIGTSSYDTDFDFSSFTNGNDVVSSYNGHGAELAFTTSSKSAANLYEAGIPAIHIPNQGVEVNKELYKKHSNRIVFVSDYDGVIGDADSEKVYQEAKKTNHENPVMAFREHERKLRDKPMELGPMGEVTKKLSRVVKYYEEQRLNNENVPEKIPFENIVVTARGGAAMERFLTTIKAHEIFVSQLHLMDGYSKNNPLENIIKENQDANIFFMDDGEVHYTRALDLKDIISGWVSNDVNIEKQNQLEKTLNKIIPEKEESSKKKNKVR